ncbi:MAG: uracil-DNA glycosylase superfamily protein [Elusimicrobia bacterium]|nr:MAG: uracil-DNA glycosylase superfamily protein [Elusimicrobiota bacterium]
MPHSFPPVVGRRSAVLILGSMPGAESLRRRQYYAHPRNQFWRLVGDALGEELTELSYRRRLAALKRRGVALWDTLAECVRPGSLDSRIRRERPNDVAGLVRRLGIRAVLLNGGKAKEMFLRHAAAGLPAGVFVAALPSSSPAAAAISYARKARVWRQAFTRGGTHQLLNKRHEIRRLKSPDGNLPSA